MMQSSVPGKRRQLHAQQAGELERDESPYEQWDGGAQRRFFVPPLAYSGYKKSSRRRHRVLRWSASVLGVVILVAGGTGYVYYQHLNENIKKDDLNIGDAKERAAVTKPNTAGQKPLNILLIGSDARDTKKNQELGGAKSTFGGAPRADVQMLLHVSADRTNISAVSMPRDTLLQLPSCTDPKSGKVYQATKTLTNDSLGRGGPGCSVATWEKLTDIHIDHFIMVDFAGVVSMADAIGGVPVCVDRNIYSHTSSGHGSGLKLKAGTTYVRGAQALQWLRTRYGFEDGSDIARTKAQHQYLSAMVRQLRENAVLSNPNKLRKLAETATNSLTVDKGLGSVTALYDLSSELKKVPSNRIALTTMPFNYVGARVIPKPGDAEKLFRLVREDIPLDGRGMKRNKATDVRMFPTADNEKITVEVQNATRTSTLEPVSGRAEAVAQTLIGEGFTEAEADHSTAFSEKTTLVRYPSAHFKGDAVQIAKAVGIPTSSVEQSTDVSGVTLVVGSDWRSGKMYTAPANNAKAPTSAKILNGAAKQCMEVDPNYTW